MPPSTGPRRGTREDLIRRAEESLREKEEQYRSIFEATSDGLVINDLDGLAVEVNPAFCEMHGYSREELIGLDLTRLHPPDAQPVYWEYLDTVRGGGVFMTQAPHLHQRKDGTQFYVEVHGARFMYKGEPHILGVVRDVTERVKAYELLEQRVEERTRELSTLLEVSHNVTSTIELEPLLHRILEQVGFVAENTNAAIVISVGGRLKMFDSYATPVPEVVSVLEQSPLDRLGVIWEMLKRGETVIIPDVRGDGELARAFREAAGPLLEDTFAFIRSWLAVPVTLKEQVAGMLALSHKEPDYYHERHAGPVTAIANQAAMAIENARLYEEARETAHTSAALTQIASRVALGGPLEATFEDICRYVVSATGAVAASVGTMDPVIGRARLVSTHGLPDGYREGMNRILEAGVPLLTQEAIGGRRAIFLRDARRKVLEEPGYAPVHPFMKEADWDTILAVPMLFGDNPVGVLFGYHTATREIDERDLSFHTALANQAAVAIQNARLLAEVQEQAAVEQRRHLARELHDSVSQALFSINLTARGIESILRRDAEGGRAAETALAKIGDLRQLTQGALAEMRALIFELRPGALEEEGLLQALHKHAAAVQARELLEVVVVCTDGVELPRLKPAAEDALYRIAQEALHNVVKHAKASSAEVSTGTEGDHLVMCVADNGVGFNPNAVPAGHLGLGTMGQRAAALGAHYEVASAPGQGTRVTVRLPLDNWRLTG